MTTSEKFELGVFERKVLREVYGPLRVKNEYRNQWNDELYEIYGDI